MVDRAAYTAAGSQGVIPSGTGSHSPRQGHPDNQTACYAVVRRELAGRQDGKGEEWIDLGTLNWDRRGAEALNEKFEEHKRRTKGGQHWLAQNPVVRIAAFRLVEERDAGRA